MWNIMTKGMKVLLAWKQTDGMGKKPWESKTIWGLFLTWGGLILTEYAGIELGTEEQAAILVAVGVILRLITGKPVGFYEDTE